jgi:sugar phosphate isomerase/epimerase
MARLSINELTTYRWSFEEDVKRYRAEGIEAIGVWRQKLADYGEDKGIELLADSGLVVSNLLWAGGFTGSDGHTYRETLSDAADAIRLAAALHAGCLVVYSGSRNGHTQNHARKLFLGALRELLPLAIEHEVTLTIEPMHPQCAGEWTFLTNLDEALSLLDTVDSPNLKLAFDTYHLGHEPAIIDHIAQIGDRIGIVHLGDSMKQPDKEQHRQRLGEGVLPLQDIVGALAATGYDGYYDVVLMGEEIEASDYQSLVKGSKRAFAQLFGSAAVQ